MITEKDAVYMSPREFDRFPKKKLTITTFCQKPDTKTMHRNYFLEGREVFIKPGGRDSWI